MLCGLFFSFSRWRGGSGSFFIILEVFLSSCLRFSYNIVVWESVFNGASRTASTSGEKKVGKD